MNQTIESRREAQITLIGFLADTLKAVRTPENAVDVDDQITGLPAKVHEMFHDGTLPDFLHLRFYRREDGFLACELALDPNDPTTQQLLQATFDGGKKL